VIIIASVVREYCGPHCCGLNAAHTVSCCDKATAVWPAREATSDVANGSHTFSRSARVSWKYFVEKFENALWFAATVRGWADGRY